MVDNKDDKQSSIEIIWINEKEQSREDRGGQCRKHSTGRVVLSSSEENLPSIHPFKSAAPFSRPLDFS
jgi:hypothetical protein